MPFSFPDTAQGARCSKQWVHLGSVHCELRCWRCGYLLGMAHCDPGREWRFGVPIGFKIVEERPGIQVIRPTKNREAKRKRLLERAKRGDSDARVVLDMQSLAPIPFRPSNRHRMKLVGDSLVYMPRGQGVALPFLMFCENCRTVNLLRPPSG